MTIQILSRLNLIEKQLFKAQDNVLVIFDVDQVLIDPVDTILSAKGDTLKVTLLKGLGQRLGIARANELYSILIKEREVRLVENLIPEYIQKLHLHGHKVMGLTAFPTHRFGKIDNVTHFRKSQLQAFNIQFDAFAPNKIFSELNPEAIRTQHHFRTPSYDDGILYTGTGGLNAPPLSKGSVLRAFLATLDWKPNSIIFIDDNFHHLQSVQECCKMEHIPFQGYHYTAANDLPGILDRTLARFQFKYLEKNDIWLSDFKAKQLMNKAK